MPGERLALLKQSYRKEKKTVSNQYLFDEISLSQTLSSGLCWPVGAHNSWISTQHLSIAAFWLSVARIVAEDKVVGKTFWEICRDWMLSLERVMRSGWGQHCGQTQLARPHIWIWTRDSVLLQPLNPSDISSQDGAGVYSVRKSVDEGAGPHK